MSEDKARFAAKTLRAAAPLPYQHLLEHITQLEASADEILASAKEEYLLRQNQGKVQVLRDLLDLLNT